ncbi:uncharacterized protein VSU04_011642 [Chlamydotis macqueenii]
MAAPVACFGDQIVMEEALDEERLLDEEGMKDFAREIGTDPEKEPELMWLAREAIRAPLPAEWKPCQDSMGKIYYFNFATGQSTWDHPCDLHYRQLVIQEREKLLAHGSSKKEEEEEGEKKKEKKEKQLLQGPTEESLKSGDADEGQESSLASDAASPPAPVRALPGDAGSGLSSQSEEESGRSEEESGRSEEESDGELAGSNLLGEQDAEVGDAVSAADELPQSRGESSAAETAALRGAGLPGAVSPAAEAAEADPAASLAATAATASEASELSDSEEGVQVSGRSDRELVWPGDLGFHSPVSEQALDVETLSPALDSPTGKALGEEEQEKSQAGAEGEQSGRAKAAEREEDHSSCEAPEEKSPSAEDASEEDAVAQEPQEGSLESLMDPEELAAPQKAHPEEDVKREESSSKPGDESLEAGAKELELALEQELIRLLETTQRIQQHQEEMRQQEEEEAEKLRQQKEESLRALKEELAKALKEEELRVRQEEAERLSKLRAEMASEAEAEKEKMR